MSLKIIEAGWGGNFFKNTHQEVAFLPEVSNATLGNQVAHHLNIHISSVGISGIILFSPKLY